MVISESPTRTTTNRLNVSGHGTRGKYKIDSWRFRKGTYTKNQITAIPVHNVFMEIHSSITSYAECIFSWDIYLCMCVRIHLCRYRFLTCSYRHCDTTSPFMMAYQMLTIQSFVCNYALERPASGIRAVWRRKRILCELGVEKFILIDICYFIKQGQMVEVSQALHVLKLNSVLWDVRERTQQTKDTLV
jgi:hypothetical protein